MLVAAHGDYVHEFNCNKASALFIVYSLTCNLPAILWELHKLHFIDNAF